MAYTIFEKNPNFVLLGRNTNQARGLGEYAIDFLANKLGTGPSLEVLARVELFHTDAVLCGLSAIALGTNAPTLLREEALEYRKNRGAGVFGSNKLVCSEKAVVANCAAVREWDSNGTLFGYNKELGHLAGEFGHNDYYPVVIAACQQRGYDGSMAVRAMVLLDEIRGRLAEVFSLKTYKIDHVVHGAIASAVTYGALMGASAEQIESAVGMVVAHYIPFRAIRAGHQLSDSKGASAAISAEVAVLSVLRSMRGFIGPQDIFRNPEAIFRLHQPTNGESPFDLVLAHSGSDFAVMGMHFKIGLYEHQSAGALQGIIDLLVANPQLVVGGADNIRSVRIRAYQPAFGIIGDPAKRDPHTRQSADHSMVYIVGTLLRKALEQQLPLGPTSDDAWKQLMLLPMDYSQAALFNKDTRALMAKIEFEHGGPEYDSRYPDGIPTSVVITDSKGKQYDSGLVMYPAGHARNTTSNLAELLSSKFTQLAQLAVNDVNEALQKLSGLATKSPDEILALYLFDIQYKERLE